MEKKKVWSTLLVSFLLLTALSLQTPLNVSAHQISAASTTSMPLLRLPWVSGSNQINVGYTYGCGDHIDNPGTIYRDAYAIDFGLPQGTEIAAVANGIAHLGNDGTTDYGQYIWIAHTNSNGSLNGYVSLYAHLSSYNVTEGQVVKQGDWIGSSGSTGNSTGPHLHFSFRSGFDGTNLSSAAPFKPEPMSGYTGFGHYGVTKDTGCNTNKPKYSPFYNASPWTQFAANSANTSYNPYETSLGIANVSQLTVEWSVLSGTASTADPAIDNGMVYTTTHYGDVYAFNQADGSQVWHQSLGYLIFPAPAVYDNVVLVSADDENVHAFKATNGNPLWTQPGYEYSKVTIANGIAYTGVNQSSPYQFAAYNVQTGKRLWIVTLPCPVNNSAAVANNDVYFTCNYPNSTLYALRTSDGSTLWSQPSAGGIPAVANGIVYIGLEPATNTDNTFAAYNANTGALIWGARLGPFAIGDPAAIVNGVVYIASENDSTSNKSTMYAMNAKTGHVIWKIGFTGHIHNNTYTGLVTTPIANGVLYMETENDVVSPSQWIVTAYNVKTRAKLWQTSSSVSATSSPVVANARLYLWYGQALCSFHVPGL